jgi:hypothetical protein
MEQAYTFVEYNAVYGEIFAAAACLWIGARLYRLASRTGAAPERLLSATFLSWGLAYLLYDLPYLMLDEGSNPLGFFFFASRISFLAAAIFIAVFTRKVFRSGKAWAGWLVSAVVACILVGLGGSLAQGHWEADYPLSNPWYWPETLGLLIPLAWMGMEGLSQYRKARRRQRLDLCSPSDSHRFLLWGLAGSLWLLLELLIVFQEIDYELTGQWSAGPDLLAGALEVIPAVLAWLAFFPPAFYRNWIERTPAVPNGEAGPRPSATR